MKKDSPQPLTLSPPPFPAEMASEEVDTFTILNLLQKADHTPAEWSPIYSGGKYFYVENFPKLNVKKYRDVYIACGCLVMISPSRTIMFADGLAAARHYFCREETIHLSEKNFPESTEKYFELASYSREVNELVYGCLPDDVSDVIADVYRNVLGRCLVSASTEFGFGTGMPDDHCPPMCNTYTLELLCGSKLDIEFGVDPCENSRSLLFTYHPSKKVVNLLLMF